MRTITVNAYALQVCCDCGQAYRVVPDVSGRGLLVIGCSCSPQDHSDRLWGDFVADQWALQEGERVVIGEDQRVYVVSRETVTA